VGRGEDTGEIKYLLFITHNSLLTVFSKQIFKYFSFIYPRKFLFKKLQYILKFWIIRIIIVDENDYHYKLVERCFIKNGKRLYGKIK
jgi:hypothetical protein